MKRIYKCIFELLLGITIVALCIFVFNFSLLGMESYIFHYPQWLLGHCLAVLFVLCIFLLLLITFNYAISHDLRLSIKKATKFISLIQSQYLNKFSKTSFFFFSSLNIFNKEISLISNSIE